MTRRPAARTALLAGLALLLVGELVARLQGDRLCSDRPGVVYERDGALGWRHVPGLSGRIGTCDGENVPATPTTTDPDGLVGPVRPTAKPPGVARILLLGGNGPEGFGVPAHDTVGHLLERYADERRGARLEVLNGATGGWAIDNHLVFFRRHGAARAPDLVLLIIDPITDLASISPAHLAALGRRVPAKPFFSLIGDRVEPTLPFAVTPPPPPAPAPGWLGASHLYRLVRGVPPYVGPPMAWAVSGTFPHGTVEEERARSRELARALLRTLRDEVAAAGGRLAVVVAPLPRAISRDATGRTEREELTAVVGSLDLPLLDLTGPVHGLDVQGRLYLPDSVRWSGPGHAAAATEIWTFLRQQNLLPGGVVSAGLPGAGRARPALAAVPSAALETWWASRHSLIGSFIQFGLVAVCIVWLVSPLPPAARDWVVAALGVLMLQVLGGPEAAGIGFGLAIAWYGAIEWLPRRLGSAACLVMVVALGALMAWANALHIPGESWAVATFLALATNVALLKLVAYAVDRRRGAVAVSLERFLAELLFFPTLPAGPLRSVAAARDEAVTGMPSGAVVLASLGRLTLGWLKCVLPPLFLVIDTMEIFTTQGAAFGRLRLWLYVGEVAALFTLLVSGWSDVAIALGRLVGTAPPENMRHPWRAPSVAEFWRRWHATLWAWWHAYVYVPLGGSERAAARNVGIVFLLSAVWHAWGISKILGWAGYPPSAWGAMLLCAGLNAGGVVASHVLDRRGPADGGPVTAVRALLTGTFVALAWLPMFLTTMTDLGGVYLRLFGLR